jgi:hypothetical protein
MVDINLDEKMLSEMEKFVQVDVISENTSPCVLVRGMGIIE